MKERGALMERFTLRNPFLRYLAGVVAVLVAFAVRGVLSFATGPDFPEYVVFYPTVMIVALMAGLWPGLFALATSALLFLLQNLLPESSLFATLRISNPLGLVFFVADCIFLTVIAELFRRTRDKAAAYDKEQAIRESQAALRQQAELLHLSFDAVVVWKQNGLIESWNRGAAELYGYTESETLGRDVHELLCTSLPLPRGEFEQQLREGRQWRGEIRRLAKNGTALIVSTRMHLGPGVDGGDRVLEIGRDITQDKRVQRELQRAHDELEDKVSDRTAESRKVNRTLLMVSRCDQALVQVTDEKELTSVISQIIKDEGDYPLVWVGFAEDEGDRGPHRVASAGDGSGLLEEVRVAWGDAALFDGPALTALSKGVPAVSADVARLPAEVRWRDAAGTRGLCTVAALPLLGMSGGAFGVLVIHSNRKGEFDPHNIGTLKELADDLAFGLASLSARKERDEAQRALELKATQLQALAGEIVRAEQRERRRIAQLLHDNLQQLLAAALYSLRNLKTAATEADREERFTAVSDQLRECIAVSRSLTSEISHPAFSEPDLAAALEWLCEWVKETHGLEVESPAGGARRKGSGGDARLGA